MNIQAQNYLVYLIVGITAINLLLPLFKSLSRLLFKKKAQSTLAQNYSAYADVCAHCTIKK